MKPLAGLVGAFALLAQPLAAQGTLILTPDGLGAVKIGMTQPQVVAALGGTLEGEAYDSDDICVEKESSKLRGVGFLFEEGKLTRISLGHGADIVTAGGIGIGTAAVAVRKAYRGKLQSEPNIYIEKPAEYLTYWSVAGKSGIRFEVNEKRKVYVISAGGPSIEYVEGCA
jgi:hypothetical protein